MISFDHLTAWAREARSEVVAVCDPHPARARERAETFGIARTYGAFEEMLADERLDAVDIITPRQTHAELVAQAAEHGIPVLCEKPVCPTLAEAEALVATVGGRIRVMVNENWRFRPYFRKIREWLEAGELGTVTSCRIALTRSSLLLDENGSIPTLRRQPFLARERRLVLAESLIHEIDTLRYLLGELEVVEAMLSRSSADVVGEDTAVVLMKGPAELPVVLSGTMVAAGHAYRAGDRLEIHGTRCSVLLDEARLTLRGARQETIEYDEAEARQESFDYSVSHFVSGLLTGQAFETDIRDQLQTMALLEKAYERGGVVTARSAGKMAAAS